ncbi:MAG: glycosyltransferase family 4 protein, partial [Parcubacteria group bacterium]
KRRIYDKARNNILAFPRESAGINNQRSSVFKIITIGRISPAKDYETLIKAAEILKKENFRFRIEIIGGIGAPEQEKYLSELKKTVADLGLGEEVIFVGGIPHNEIINYLATADLFINMSRTGSLDKAILEAMAAGLSVVTSNEAAVKMLSAFAEQMVFPQKDFTALAEQIKFFIQLPDSERIKYGESLRKIVESEHGLKGLIQKIIENYV